MTGTRKKPPVDPTSAEWKTLENLEKVLRPLHEATKFVSKEKYPIISSVSPLFRRIFDLHLLASANDDEISKSFKEVIRSDLMKRWGSLLDDMPDAFVLAVYLDVRLKDFSFVVNENQRASLVTRSCPSRNEQLFALPSQKNRVFFFSLARRIPKRIKNH